MAVKNILHAERVLRDLKGRHIYINLDGGAHFLSLKHCSCYDKAAQKNTQISAWKIF